MATRRSRRRVRLSKGSYRNLDGGGKSSSITTKLGNRTVTKSAAGTKITRTSGGFTATSTAPSAGAVGRSLKKPRQKSGAAFKAVRSRTPRPTSPGRGRAGRSRGADGGALVLLGAVAVAALFQLFSWLAGLVG